MVMEAVAIRVRREDEKAAKKAQVKEWQKQTTSLDQFR